MKKITPRLQALTRNPLFWVFQVIVFVACVLLSVHFYPKAFPVVDLEIKLTRSQALAKAKALAEQHRWGPLPSAETPTAQKAPSVFRQTAAFSVDQMTQTFVELSAGGNAAFKKVLQEGLYFPYTWSVRNFAEGVTRESHVLFTPEGRFYGFSEKLEENQPGAARSFEAARKIAESSVQKNWGVDLSPFKLVENSQERKPGNRVDHNLVYERESKTLGEGRFRLRLEVSGDRLTEVSYFIKIPEAFARKYSEMRSFNNTISAVASVLMAILYLVGGCIVGLFFLGRVRWILWKMPVICGVFISALQALEKINQLPLMWMSYDTAIGTHEFLLRFASNLSVMFVLDALLLSVSFMAAESLSRRAFPHHPQLWRIWAPGNANSIGILGRTLGGYLSVGVYFTFVVFAYLFGRRYLHWWTPSDTLFQPDSLASYFPWFTSISHSLHAGFWEESLFRAVPLAGAALLGTRFGNRKKWIFGAFILQAVIFAAAHANYPAQPSYARVIELLLPSCFFASFYLLFGLLPGIIAHFTFDVAAFGIPIFCAKVPGIWRGVTLDQILIVLLTLTPLWILLFFRLRQGRWVELKTSEYNQGWTPPRASASPQNTLAEIPAHRQPGPWVIGAVATAGLVAGVVWIFGVQFKSDVPVLEITRKDAVRLAEQELIKRKIDLTEGWEPISSVHADLSMDHRFIWKTEGREMYRRLALDYLIPPTWVVRFVRFNTDIVKRAEEYVVVLRDHGKVLMFNHRLPESQEGASLSQEAAKRVARRELNSNEKEAASHFKDLSSVSSKLPKRMDWQFIFSDQNHHLKTGEARLAIGIAGDESVFFKKFIFIPEEWQRTERARENLMSIVKVLSNLVLLSMLVAGIIVALMNWSRKKFDRKTYFVAFAGLLLIESVDFVNSIPARVASFSTAEPKYNQLANTFLFGGMKILVSSAGLALLIGYLHHRSRQSKPYSQLISAVMGYGGGLLAIWGSLIVMKLLPDALPAWGKLDGFDSYLPILRPLQDLSHYVMLSVIFLIVGNFMNQLTRHWTQRRVLGSLLLLVFGAAFSGLHAPSLYAWAIYTLALTSYLVLACQFVFNSHFSLIPLGMASVFVLSSWKQMQLHPYTGSTEHNLFSGLAVVTLAWIWFKSLRSQKRQ